MKVILSDSQGIKLAINPLTKAGNPAEVESFSVTSLDETVCTVELVQDEPKAFIVKSAGKIGLTQVALSADADLGEGVKNIEGVVDVEIKAGEAVTLGAVIIGEPFELS